MQVRPYLSLVLESKLSPDEIRSRVLDCSIPTPTSAANRRARFVGHVGEDRFSLTPLIWGQSSFLPQFLGRVIPSPLGARIELQIVPNPALLICLLIVYSFMGILVYDKNWGRVLATTGANMLLAAIPLLTGFWFAVEPALKKLIQSLDAVPVADRESAFRDRRPLIWRIGSWLVALCIVTIGTWLWSGVHSGRLTLSMRPAIDLVTIAWTTLGLIVLWLFTISGISPLNRVRTLLILFALLIGWSWTATVDGYGGDGRPMFTFRWRAKDEAVDSTTALARNSDQSLPEVSLLSGKQSGKAELTGFRGSRRDGVFSEPSLDADWQRHPPEIVWHQPIGIGWSSYVAANGYAVTQEQRGPDEAVVCYELATGRERWEHRDTARFHEMMGGDGPRATPTLDEGDVYALGATGILNRLDGRNGRPVWTINVIEATGAPTSLFGMTGSPLIFNDLVIVNPGSPKASLIAYDKKTGTPRWAAGTSLTAYASPQLVRLGDRDQILAFNADGVFSHAVENGEILWSYPWVTPPEFNNVCQPVLWMDDEGRETVFLSSGYGKGCALLEIALRDNRFTATPRWQNKNLKVKFSSVVARNGFVYGLDENILVCLDLRTGQRRWKNGRYGYGQLILVDDHLVILSEDGEVMLCEATPDDYRELARMPVLNGRTWNHPALVGDTLLVRNDRAAACLKLPVKSKRP